MRIYQSYDPEKVDKKSKEFLKRIIGEEQFDKLQKGGKIEIEVNNKSKEKIVYELYSDGRVINKTKNQSYCIVADRSDYPIDDLIAIKYAWLVHNNKFTEKVANKSPLGHHIGNTQGYIDFVRDMERRGWNRQQVEVNGPPGYGEYVDYLSTIGWYREQITIDEHNTNMVSVNNVQQGSTGNVIDIVCPAGMKISIMGRQQIPRGVDVNVAYPLSLYITDDNGEEIPPYTKIRITKSKPTEEIIQLARIFYSDININQLIVTNNIVNNDHSDDNSSTSNPIYGRRKRTEELYRFMHGIEMNGEEHLKFFVVNSDRYIPAENIKFGMDLDLWIRA